jgi:purine-nucleoside phosphorylase
MVVIPTPHIRAKEGDFADIVLMPGDPLRAKFIAETYFEAPKLITDVRNMLGFTGTYKGKRISVMGSGMGMPSMGLYAHELYEFYNVQKIVRIGSAGSISEKCQIMDIVIAQATCTNSAWADQFELLGGTYAPIADFDLLYQAVEAAKKLNQKVVVGNVLSEDQFYHASPNYYERWRKLGVLCLEMESAALYMEAARCGRQALAIFTISDEILTGKELDAEARQLSFREMMELALELN